ncbi:MAG TPA: sulfotransferase [Sphingomonas sp.]
MASVNTLDQQTAGAIRQAMAAAQAGDVAHARRLAEGALVRGGDVVALNAFLGMLLARSGDVPGAVLHLRAAHQARPGDVTIACNLIAVLTETGDLAGALDVATRDLALADPTLRVARYRGFLAQSLSRFGDAAEAYDYVVAQAPDDFESWNNLGNARAALADERSVDALQRAVALDPRAAPTRINLATALRAAGRGTEAADTLRQAAADFPDDARPLNDLYVLLKEEGDDSAALAALEQAITRDPANANLRFKAAIEYGLVNRLDDAEATYRTTIAMDPSLDDAWLGLAIQYEHTNREEEFPALIAEAEEKGVSIAALGFLRALDHRRAKRFEEGLASLSDVPASVEPERSAHLRATLLDRLGRTDAAFHWFAEASRLHAASADEPLKRATAYRQALKQEIAEMTPAWFASWSDADPAPTRPDPVFLIGFPRSGTTLLDTILMGHPGTTVLEEQPPLYLVDGTIGGFTAISALDDAGILAARARYFEEVEKIEPLADGTLLIDKSPLFLHEAPLIQRLFPRARFILALRHPCDVVLSCFMSNFKLNDATSSFLRIEDAADLYDIAFRHWETARSLLPLTVHSIVYERLVEDVEREVRPLFDFLGLDWREEVLDHTRTAKSRGLITTASYSQVTEPIYRRAAGRWQRYRAHLDPILPVLEPWVEKFGYTL